MDNVKSQKKTYILEPDEYKTSLQMHPGTTGHFIYTKGIFITKDGENKWCRTVFNVDEGCRLQLTWNGRGNGKVKYLTSTPRRNYYLALMWFTLCLWTLAWIFTVVEVSVLGNYASGGSRTSNVLLTAFTAWMGLDIVHLRNGHGFTKWAVTIFSYFILAVSFTSFVVYIVRLIQGS